MVHWLVDNLEKYYRDNVGVDKREHIASLAVFILAAFLAPLRGEEVFKLTLGETRFFIGIDVNHKATSHCSSFAWKIQG